MSKDLSLMSADGVDLFQHGGKIYWLEGGTIESVAAFEEHFPTSRRSWSLRFDTFAKKAYVIVQSGVSDRLTRFPLLINPDGSVSVEVYTDPHRAASAWARREARQ